MKMSTTKRAFYSISADVLEKFNAAYSPRQRRRMIEAFMRDRLKGGEARVIEAARAIAEDPQAAREHEELSKWVDAQSAHTLTNF